MAPRGSKRAELAQSLQGSPKKQRSDPKLAGIIATLQNAGDLNEHCREMLIAMTSGLAKPKAERHPAQTLGVAMIEETLQDAQAKFAEAVAAAQDELSNLETSNSTVLVHMGEAEALLKDKQSVRSAGHSSLDAAKQAVVTAENALASLKELQRQGDESVAFLEKEKATLEAAFQEHLKTPMETDQILAHHFLQPFVNKLDLEESLKMALPSSCVKTKEQRGSFDDLVISELVKAWNKKIAFLAKSIEDEAPVGSEHKAAVLASEASSEDTKRVEQTASTELEAARVAEVEAEGEVSKAKEESAVLGPKLKQVADKHSSLKVILDDYVAGTLATFEALRDKEEAAEEVAAPAGA